MHPCCPTFPYHGRHNGIDFWFDPECPSIREAVRDTVAGPGHARTILKQDEKRLVFLGGESSAVVKINRLPRWKDRFRAARFAPEECHCHLRIQQFGIPVPRLWGFFEQRRLGLTIRNGLVIDFLPNCRNLAFEECEHAIPILCALHKSGVNHPDFMCNNLMLDSSGNHCTLIDLERCSFVDPGDFRLVLMNLARYIEYGRHPFPHPRNQAMVEKTYAAVTAPPVGYDLFHELLAKLCSKHLTTRERVGLILPDDIRTRLENPSAR